MYSKDTHLIPSGLALAVWFFIMLVNRQMHLCCFVAHLQSQIFVILTLPISRQIHNKYVSMSCSLFSWNFNQK